MKFEIEETKKVSNCVVGGGEVRSCYDDAAGEGDPPQRPHPTASLTASTSSTGFGLSPVIFATINRLYQRFISNRNLNCIPQESFGAVERYAFYLLQLVLYLIFIHLF